MRTATDRTPPHTALAASRTAKQHRTRFAANALSTMWVSYGLGTRQGWCHSPVRCACHSPFLRSEDRRGDPHPPCVPPYGELKRSTTESDRGSLHRAQEPA